MAENTEEVLISEKREKRTVDRKTDARCEYINS